MYTVATCLEELTLALKEMPVNNCESLAGASICLMVTSEASGTATVLAQPCRQSSCSRGSVVSFRQQRWGGGLGPSLVRAFPLCQQVVMPGLPVLSPKRGSQLMTDMESSRSTEAELTF